jgi:hypothetical protein
MGPEKRTVLIAALFGFVGAVFTYYSFYDARAAEGALFTLLPCAALVLALPDKQPNPKWPNKKTR